MSKNILSVVFLLCSFFGFPLSLVLKYPLLLSWWRRLILEEMLPQSQAVGNIRFGKRFMYQISSYFCPNLSYRSWCIDLFAFYVYFSYDGAILISARGGRLTWPQVPMTGMISPWSFSSYQSADELGNSKWRLRRKSAWKRKTSRYVAKNKSRNSSVYHACFLQPMSWSYKVHFWIQGFSRTFWKSSCNRNKSTKYFWQYHNFIHNTFSILLFHILRPL